MESASTSNLLQLKATAMVTIKKDNPDVKTGGQLHLSVEGNHKISFIRFELPSDLGDANVTKATLNLYSTSHNDELIEVSIAALPHGGKWSDGTVSWNDQLESRDSFVVTSFGALELESGNKKKLYEVDVTSALDLSSKWITFKLSTESSGRLDFASETWEGGKAVPELMLALSSSIPESAKTDTFDKLKEAEEEIQNLSDQETKQEKDVIADMEEHIIEEALEEVLEEGTPENDSDFEAEAANLEEEIKEDLEGVCVDA